MCICINCRWVDRCKAYHSVELQHGVPHLNANPDIEPMEPIIHVIRQLANVADIVTDNIPLLLSKETLPRQYRGGKRHSLKIAPRVVRLTEPWHFLLIAPLQIRQGCRTLAHLRMHRSLGKQTRGHGLPFTQK